jgi:low temperature requirement protein LtrA
LLSIAGSSVVIIFAMWWLYFDRPVHHLVTSPRVAQLWGYGQYLIFGAAAAVGAGLAVNLDWQTGAAHLGRRAVGYATAMPVAVYLLAVWALHARPYQRRMVNVAYLVTALPLLLTPLTAAPIPVTAVLLAGLAATTVLDCSARTLT